MKEVRPKKKFHTLIIDDDLNLCEVLFNVIEKAGGSIRLCHTTTDAIQLLSEDTYDLVVLDNRLPDGLGSSVFWEMQRAGKLPTVILLTAFPDLSEAVKLTQHGLFHYLQKPFQLKDFEELLIQAIHHFEFEDRVPELPDLYGESVAMQLVREKVTQAANNPAANVLITGPTGVGKELAAQIIHSQTSFPVGTHPEFVAIDCSALPAELIEAELFGAEKGAYTGAYQTRVGLVEAANGGTVFLDEIGDMLLIHQTRLLRFLETREYRRVGSNKSAPFRGRVIAATNRDLKSAVRAGTFRQDLYYRLEVLSIELPTLSERAEDIPGIANNLLGQLCEKYRRAKPYVRSADLQALKAYSFPGNVRELRNIIERSLLQTPHNSGWLEMRGMVPLIETPAAPTPKRFRPSLVEPPLSPYLELPLVNVIREEPPVYQTLKKVEYDTLQQALAAEGHVITKVARRLGISRQAVLRRLEKWPELRRLRNPSKADS